MISIGCRCYKAHFILLTIIFINHLTFAACLSGTDYYKIYIHSKRLGEKIVFDVPEKFHPKIFENSFILNFGYPDIDPHPINSYLNKKSTVRLIIDGDGVGNSRADRELDNENKKYSKTEGGVDVYQGEVRNGIPNWCDLGRAE